MRKTRVWLLGIICCLVVCLAGCGQKTSTEEKGKGKTLEYTVVPAEDVPDTLKKEIDKRRSTNFRSHTKKVNFSIWLPGMENGLVLGIISK